MDWVSTNMPPHAVGVLLLFMFVTPFFKKILISLFVFINFFIITMLASGHVLNKILLNLFTVDWSPDV